MEGGEEHPVTGCKVNPTTYLQLHLRPGRPIAYAMEDVVYVAYQLYHVV